MEVQWPLVFNIALGIIFGLLGSAILVGIGFAVVRKGRKSGNFCWS